jgi:hypothetical protein
MCDPFRCERMERMSVAVIVASNREEGIAEFVRQWDIRESDLYKVFVIEDGPIRTFDLPACVSHHAHKDIPEGMKDLVPRRTSAIKSLGIYFAWREECEHFLVLDDDCLPSFRYPNLESLIHAHLAILHRGIRAEEYEGRFFSTLEGDYARGFPDSEKLRITVPVQVSVGSWCGVPDLDGRTQLRYELKGVPMPQGNFRSQIVTKGVSYAFSGMHVFFSRSVAPYMFFFPTNDRFFRYDDIWLGFVLKRLLDGQGLAMHHSGEIFVLHSRLSVSTRNHELESRNEGYAVNDHFYRSVRSTCAMAFPSVRELFEAIKTEAGMPYFSDVLDRYLKWIGLFAKESAFEAGIPAERIEQEAMSGQAPALARTI